LHAIDTGTPVLVVVTGVMGILGFLLASALGYFEWHRYHIPLKLQVRELEVHRSPDGIHFLVFLRLSFVNPATRGKTVFHILLGKPDNATVSQPPYEYDETHDTLKYWIPNTPYVEAYLSEDKTLVFPLDIPPHQSRSKWHPLLFEMREAVQGFDIPIVHIEVFAKDVFGKTIAKYDERVELKTHTIH